MSRYILPEGLELELLTRKQEKQRDASRNAEDLPVHRVLFFFKCIITLVFALFNPVLSYFCHLLSIMFPYSGSVFMS